jgi:DNA invertase Pin-like site-specific DNA recombinase
MRLIGYVRLSKDNANGHSLNSQHDAIAQWCRANGHDLVTVVAEVRSAKTPSKLAARRLAVAAIHAGMADGMVVRDLDRVTRSTFDGADLLRTATVNGWTLYGAADGIDTSDPQQALTIDIKIAVAAEERRKLAERTRSGLVTARRNGSKVGKPRQVKPEVERRIHRLAKQGLSAYAIAKRLDQQGVPTPQGGKAWSPSVVRDVINRQPTKAAS